jgi:BASS family bile acid:Na+ symporter
MQVDVLTKFILPSALFLIMFGIGLSLKPSGFAAVFRSPRAAIIGLGAQMLALPILAFLAAIAFRLPPEIAVGLIIIALAPGGATSNLFTYLSKGDVPLSICLTAIVSLITPFTIPLITALSMAYFMGDSTEFAIPIAKTIIQLLVITVVPIVLGMATLFRWPAAARRMESALRLFSIFFLLLIIALIVLKNAGNMGSFFAQSGLATLVLNLAALTLGYLLANWSRLSHSQSVSIGFEVGIQNGTLALFVAGTVIGNEVMMIPAVTYSLIMLVSGVAFGWWVRNRNIAPGSVSPGPVQRPGSSRFGP